MCPSAPAAEGAVVLGVVDGDGSIEYLRDKMVATPVFIATIKVGRDPEERFRFASPCQECHCTQWVDGECSIPKRVTEIVPNSPEPTALPRCSIRAHCRWYHQAGADACRICPRVVTRGPLRDAEPHERT